MKRNISIEKDRINTGALDYSYLLDAPAGKHGFVQVKDGHLYYEDGTRARFFGFNFPVRSNMPDHESAERLSARLASMGVNAVRLCAADVPPAPGGWSTHPDYPLLNYPGGTTREFYAPGLDRFEYWIYCLEQKGIYLHIDLLVARSFLEGDDLDYPVSLHATKSSSHLNRTLIERQKEYASMLLTHVNPYTGRALIDDPAVMTIQITNEDSIFFDVAGARKAPGVSFYKNELKQRFNHFLSAKYGSRAHLEQAWTHEDTGVCELAASEDPAQGTVDPIEIGDYFQPMSPKAGDEGAARYADFAAFGIGINKDFYQEMMDHIKSLGARVPVATSCLLLGAADIYSHSMGDVMENNAYFNHPDFFREGVVRVPNLREYITTDPLTETYSGFEPRSNLVVQASCAAIAGKPFILSEWNEYGEHPFHSSSFLMTTAYACLNDWDGLFVYDYHCEDTSVSEDHEGRRPDRIEDIMDAWNDPSLIQQWGTLSAMFLQEQVQTAKQTYTLVYRQQDLLQQNEHHRMPHSYFSLVGKLRTFIANADNAMPQDGSVLISAGFVSGGSETDPHLAEAPFTIQYEHTDCLDAHGKHHNPRSLEERFASLQKAGKCLTLPDLEKEISGTDYRPFASAADRALKANGFLAEVHGLKSADGQLTMISDTGEIAWNPAAGVFCLNTPALKAFSGHTDSVNSVVRLSDEVTFTTTQDVLTIELSALDGTNTACTDHLLLTAIGRSGVDEATYEKDPNYAVNNSTFFHMDGKLYAECPEGTLEITCGDLPYHLWALDVYGERIAEIPSSIDEVQQKQTFVLTAKDGFINYELKR